eukprot:11975396-Alexandrium_andersonii.AAC.1
MAGRAPPEASPSARATGRAWCRIAANAGAPALRRRDAMAARALPQLQAPARNARSPAARERP